MACLYFPVELAQRISCHHHGNEIGGFCFVPLDLVSGREGQLLRQTRNGVCWSVMACVFHGPFTCYVLSSPSTRQLTNSLMFRVHFLQPRALPEHPFDKEVELLLISLVILCVRKERSGQQEQKKREAGRENDWVWRDKGQKCRLCLSVTCTFSNAYNLWLCSRSLVFSRGSEWEVWLVPSAMWLQLVWLFLGGDYCWLHFFPVVSLLPAQWSHAIWILRRRRDRVGRGRRVRKIPACLSSSLYHQLYVPLCWLGPFVLYLTG